MEHGQGAGEAAAGQSSSATSEPERVIPLDLEHLERHRIVAFNKHNLISSVFDLLRTQVLHKMKANNWRTLAVVSPTEASGKTVLAINLSMSIAHLLERSALLVDFDFRRPSVLRYLGTQSEKSLHQYLHGQCTLDEVLIHPQLPRFSVLGNREPVANPAELLGSSRTENFLQELREQNEERIVLIDLPPLISADDALAVLPRIDCAIMVVANGLSSEQEVRDSLRIVRQMSSTQLLGTVLNKSRDEQIRNPYGYTGEGA
ncbi:protein tyrosine kinase [Mangrovimicrobium sediminis]|uniref:Protein tyrosine kinase n=2 Tax=Mangrovimicrobium sediminis TaxID=2562682 RepID=A0A4Z0M4C7_9GAMM|nr:protein tyrosine kinase [Haliea sp. SAOS-164]